MGIVKMRKVASRLSFKEGKPQGYQLRQLVYAPIKEKDLIKYMANSANVPESTKPPKEKYKKTGENIKKHDLFIYFYLFLSIFLSATLKQVPAERLSGLNGDFNFSWNYLVTRFLYSNFATPKLKKKLKTIGYEDKAFIDLDGNHDDGGWMVTGE